MDETSFPYYRPDVNDADVAAVVDCLRNGWLTTGARAVALEEDFAALCDVKHAIALNSCTSGILLGLVALGVAPGDEVILPSLSFVAGAQCVEHLGATPVFCDIEASTLCLSVDTVAPLVTDRTRAIMPMHYAGRPVHISPILSFAKARGIAVLEDAALSVGMLDSGRAAGALSAGAAYSFYATKNITSAEGGIFVTNDDRIAESVRTHSLHGMTRDAYKRYEANQPWQYDIVASGYKCNLPDVLATLAHSQLKRLDQMQSKREVLAQLYCDLLSDVTGIQPAALDSMQEYDKHSWCFFPIKIDERLAGITRDNIVQGLQARGIGTSVHYIPSHLFWTYRDRPHAPLPATDSIWRTLVSLPLYTRMQETDVERVVACLRDVLHKMPAETSR